MLSGGGGGQNNSANLMNGVRTDFSDTQVKHTRKKHTLFGPKNGRRKKEYYHLKTDKKQKDKICF